ncbi:lysosomal Pro-X carboxypeptidase-like [Canna indica]|uniref:Lysosomal Pro-X carboxypeptidase-like n=1 Tax=Canna indica TaxID=4628 RepID=A0AAQ3Q9S1_9LILI|nr:lysosomal Pro-X carboxypeptidase-like [Canna indica]
METSRATTLLFLLFLPCSVLCSASRTKSAFPLRRRELMHSSDQGLYATRYFTQTLDHFNYKPESYATFQQKYLVNDTFWGGKGAPIFVYAGNEGSIEWFAQNTGFMFDVAPLFKAMLIFIEHRYYGESVPFGSEKAAYSNTSTLGYLSSTQALADYATLIIDLKKNLSSDDSPVVAFGGSYGGMLAAWFRLKYPHVAIGALASSAPILQFDDIISPYTFNDIITNDYKSESESCYRTIKNSWKELEDVFNQPGGAEKLAKAFKICNGKVDDLESWIETAFVYGAMTDYPTASNFLTHLPAYPVKQMCKAIDNPTSGNDTFARLYGAMNIYYNYTGAAQCFDLNPSSEIGYNGWGWQSCTEMVLPTEGSSERSIFPAQTYNYTEYAESCQAYYGITPRPHWITTEFGGHHIDKVLKRFGSNIIFFNGLRDPWSGGGVLKSPNPSLIAIVAPKGAHHVDLRFATKEDPIWLQKVREMEIGIITKWLEEYYADFQL